MSRYSIREGVAAVETPDFGVKGGCVVGQKVALMKHLAVVSLILAAGVVTPGCSVTSVTDVMRRGSPETQPQVQARQDLAMPPDLQLHPPGTAPAPPPQLASVPEESYTPPPATKAQASAASPTQGTATQPEGDIYQRYGISKTHPDGRPKTAAELQIELKKARVAEKQQANPNYGTVFNIGNIFADE